MTAQHRFEDRLLHQLRQVVADRPASATPARRRPRATRLALAGAGVAAATAAVAVFAATGDRTPSAYAVQSQANGAVTVSIHSLSDAEGLQRSLRAAGIPAVVDYVAHPASGCVGPGPGAESGTRAGSDDGPSFSTGGSSEGPTVTRHAPPGVAAGKLGPGGKVTSQIRIGEDGAATFTIDPGTLQPGDRVFITTSTGAVSSVGIAIGKEKPAC